MKILINDDSIQVIWFDSNMVQKIEIKYQKIKSKATIMITSTNSFTLYDFINENIVLDLFFSSLSLNILRN